jgi:hypothetical protein
MTKAAEAAADVDRRIFETTIRPAITAATIAEHRENPFSAHSPALEIVLRYLRRNPVRSKPRYLLVELEPFQKWCLALYSRRRGVPPTLTDEHFSSRAEAQHAIFIRRLLDLEDPEVTRIVHAAEG